MTKKKSGASPETKRQQAYHQRVIEDGGKRVVLVLKREEAAELAEAAATHGGQKDAIMAGILALNQRANDLTPEQVAEWVLRQGRRPLP